MIAATALSLVGTVGVGTILLTMYNLIASIVDVSGVSKANRRACKRLVGEANALRPILKDVEKHFELLPPSTQESISEVLPLLQTDLEEVFTFISQQKRGRAPKFMKNVISNAFQSNSSLALGFEDLDRNIERDTSTLILALMNQISASSLSMASSSSSSERPSSSSSSSSSLTSSSSTTDTRDCVSVVFDEGRPSLYDTMMTEKTSTKDKWKEAITLLHDEDIITYARSMLQEEQDPITPEVAQEVHYSIACAHARQGRTEQAIIHLYSAQQNGFCCPDHLSSERSLACLHSHPDFIQLLSEMNEQIARNARWRGAGPALVDEWTRQFNLYNTDGNGYIDRAELTILVRRCHDPIMVQLAASCIPIEEIFRQLDTDGNDKISLDEYLNFMTDRTTSSAPSASPMMMAMTEGQNNDAAGSSSSMSTPTSITADTTRMTMDAPPSPIHQQYIDAQGNLIMPPQESDSPCYGGIEECQQVPTTAARGYSPLASPPPPPSSSYPPPPAGMTCYDDDASGCSFPRDVSAPSQGYGGVPLGGFCYGGFGAGAGGPRDVSQPPPPLPSSPYMLPPPLSYYDAATAEGQQQQQQQQLPYPSLIGGGCGTQYAAPAQVSRQPVYYAM